jgi:4-hydroxy-tetrahydrodipicolinate synthase
MSNESLKVQGIIPALITPMNEDGTVSEEGLQAVIDHVIDGGIHGIFILGSQGESFALTLEEKTSVIKASIRISAGRVPVYVGTGMITTTQSVQMTALARELGADAVSVITPYFIKPSQRELIDHYRAVADAAGDMPVLLYNNPMRTAVSIDVETVVTLAEIDNVAGMKDSSADLLQTMKYIDATRDMNFSVLVGNDASIYATMMCGGQGAVAATANVAPALIVGIYDAVKAGDIDKARELQYKLFPIRQAFTLGTFPLVVKEAMNIMGLPAGPARKPIQPLLPEKRAELEKILIGAGLLKQ